MNEVDYGAARFFLDLLQLVGLVLLAIYTHFASRSKANRNAINTLRDVLDREVEQMEQRVAQGERRLDVFESRLNGAPTHNDLSAVYTRLNTVAENMENLSGHMTAVAHQLTIVNEYLLNNRGGRG